MPKPPGPNDVVCPCLFADAAPVPSTSYSDPAAASCLLAKRWATKKQAGSTKNTGGHGHPKFLGIKMSHGQLIFPGQIILRQRGLKCHPGYHVGVGRDQTLFSTTVGFIKFKDERHLRHNRAKWRKYVSVQPLGDDWSEEYSEKVKKMVAARAVAKERLLTPP